MYLEHAMGTKELMDAELTNYERKDDLAQTLQEYVKSEDLAKQLKDYVPRDFLVKEVSTYVSKTVAEEIAKDVTKDKIGEIAESKVKQLMKQDYTSIEEKLAHLTNRLDGLEDSCKPTQAEAKEKAKEEE